MKETGIFQSLLESIGLSSGRRLGVHVLDSAMRYVVLAKNGTGYVVDAYGEVPLEPGSVDVGTALKRLTKKIGISKSHVVKTEDDVTAATARAVLRFGDAHMIVVDASHVGDDVSAAAREIDRHLVRRYAETDAAGNRLPKAEGIVLVGEHPDMPRLAEQLSALLRISVSVGDVWTNLLLPEHGVSKLPRRESLRYAAAIGAALA